MLSRIMAVAIIGLAVCVLSADAQGKKKADATGIIEIVKNKEGEFRYRIKGAEGKTIAMPLPQMSWKTKDEVLKAIGELKAILNTATPIDEFDDKKTNEKKATDTKKATDKKKAG